MGTFTARWLRSPHTAGPASGGRRGKLHRRRQELETAVSAAAARQQHGRYREDCVHDLAVGGTVGALLDLGVIQTQQVVEPGEKLVLAHEKGCQVLC